MKKLTKKRFWEMLSEIENITTLKKAQDYRLYFAETYPTDPANINALFGIRYMLDKKISKLSQ